MTKLYLMLLAVFLSACATTNPPDPEPIIVTQEVLVPVAQPCVPASLAPTPEYVDTDSAILAAVDAAVRYQLLWAGRMQRNARLAELETTIVGCPRVAAN